MLVPVKHAVAAVPVGKPLPLLFFDETVPVLYQKMYKYETKPIQEPTRREQKGQLYPQAYTKDPERKENYNRIPRISCACRNRRSSPSPPLSSATTNAEAEEEQKDTQSQQELHSTKALR